ncbi:MAG: DNA lyase [Candidatus Muiribacterium halophilum]|uniref:8-oxoguanine DNA glycosylase/AP lyase n=1 Tax=Muiribacterium halophilum TaxID=2053465 RepID=A0A2N5ZFF6_MUIH1|nr:MAG: DNA lyase [Candidatus Muirbacterium halophilum]
MKEYDKVLTKEITELYTQIKDTIKERLKEFRNKWEIGSEEDILSELVFCIFTPQSKAVRCWNAVCVIKEKGHLVEGSREDYLECINEVRFKNRKSEFAIMARDRFIVDGKVKIKEFLNSFKDNRAMRLWLRENIKGYGLKEASHFLRNIGLGHDLAILDRHILKNLVSLKIIKEIPKNLNDKRYLNIEKELLKFCKFIDIPAQELDMLLWYKEAGHVFK